MYVCPICNREFIKVEDVAKHSLSCWRAQNPNHKSNPAPRGEDIEVREVEDGVLDFFRRLKGE